MHSYWERYLWSHEAPEFPFNFAPKYAATKVREIVMVLKLCGTIIALCCRCEFMGENIDTIRKNTESLIHANKEAALEVSSEKSKHMMLSRHRNAGQKHEIKAANASLENVAESKDLGATARIKI
jgi:hypothetical protein